MTRSVASKSQRQQSTTTVVRRRPIAERRALEFLRGGSEPVDSGVDRVPIPFAQLRGFAQENGFHIFSPDVPYVGEGELQLLAWIAQAQRARAYPRSFHEDERLNRAIFYCAGLVAGLGIVLPAVTMLEGPWKHAQA